MRRWYVLALVLATALIFTTVGYYVRTLRDSQGEDGECIFARQRLEHLATLDPFDAQVLANTINAYNDNCR